MQTDQNTERDESPNSHKLHKLRERNAELRLDLAIKKKKIQKQEVVVKKLKNEAGRNQRSLSRDKQFIESMQRERNHSLFENDKTVRKLHEEINQKDSRLEYLEHCLSLIMQDKQIGAKARKIIDRERMSF